MKGILQFNSSAETDAPDLVITISAFLNCEVIFQKSK